MRRHPTADRPMVALAESVTGGPVCWRCLDRPPVVDLSPYGPLCARCRDGRLRVLGRALFDFFTDEEHA